MRSADVDVSFASGWGTPARMMRLSIRREAARGFIDGRVAKGGGAVCPFRPAEPRAPGQRELNREVDFVVRLARAVVAIEVKSGRSRDTPPGLGAFAETFKPARTLVVGTHGIPLADFLLQPVTRWRPG